MNNSSIKNNRVGLELKNSPSIIYQSDISSNAVGIIAEKSPIQLIDSVVHNIIVDGINQIIRTQPVSIHTNPFQIQAQAQDYLNNKDEHSKRRKFRRLLATIHKCAGVGAQYLACLKQL